MMWQLSHRCDPLAKELADRHYNRQNKDSKNFVPPGGCCVLYAHTETGKAFWVTATPFGQYVLHRWPNAWVCSAFRNEGAGIASHLIYYAIQASVYMLGLPPERGMLTFIDKKYVKPTMVRGKPVYGFTYMKVGFEPDGESKSGKLAFVLPPDKFPPADRPHVPESLIKKYQHMIQKRPEWKG